MSPIPERVVLEGVEPYQVGEPLFEAVRVVLSYRGERYSPAYIQGVSGAAFRIAGICPCAPTCSSAMWTDALPTLLGYEVTHLTLASCGVEPGKLLALAQCAAPGQLAEEAALDDPDLLTLRRALAAMVAHIKEEIRQGRPVVLWHGFTLAEFDVVAGFDEATGTFLGRGSYAGTAEAYAQEPQFRTLTAADVGGWPSAVLIGARRATPDLATLERSALEEAVRHAHSQTGADQPADQGWVFQEGLRCYDQWIRHFRQDDAQRGLGDAYCQSIYHATHRAAAAFLREIAPRHAGASAALVAAAQQFDAEADALAALAPLLGWQAPEGADAERNWRIVAMLTEARAAYAAGIQAIERALAQLDPPTTR